MRYTKHPPSPQRQQSPTIMSGSSRGGGGGGGGGGLHLPLQFLIFFSLLLFVLVSVVAWFQVSVPSPVVHKYYNPNGLRSQSQERRSFRAAQQPKASLAEKGLYNINWGRPEQLQEEEASSEVAFAAAANIPNYDEKQIQRQPKEKILIVREKDGEMVDDDNLARDNAAGGSDLDTVYKQEDKDKFDEHEENSIKLTSKDPVSTFSVDVDTASYSYARRQLQNGKLPPPHSIKVEEFINYFEYSYLRPEGKEVPFEPSVMVSHSPWNEGRKLLHIGIQGYDIESLPLCNLVFLVDISGSMNSPDKLPLAKTAMEQLLQTRQPDDLISIVTYSSSTQVALPPTPAKEIKTILSALQSLQANGSTWGQGGIELAYQVAQENFDPNKVNRILLVSDGDFNVGVSDAASLQKLVESKRDSGIFLSVLGFGMGNYKDTTMKALANHGNGVAAYIDTVEEAQKVMVKEASSTIFPIAKDVKIQVEFNPSTVAEYRLVGYEKRALRNEDFNNDKVDAGDIGSGHTVTAIYEFTTVDSEKGRAMDPLRYEQVTTTKDAPAMSSEYAYLKIRYKLPNESESKLISRPISKDDEEEAMLANSMGFRTPLTILEFKFASAVAGFAQLLKGSRYVGNLTYQSIREAAANGLGMDPNDYRKQLIELVETTETLSKLQRSSTPTVPASEGTD